MAQWRFLLNVIVIGLSSVEVGAQNTVGASSLPGRLMMFPLLPGQRPSTLPHIMDLSIGTLSPAPELAGVAPFWSVPLAYDWQRNLVYFVEESRCALGRIDLRGSQPGTAKREIKAIDTCFVGESINTYRRPLFTSLSDLYARDSFLVRRKVADDGSVELRFQRELQGGLTHLAVASQLGDIYCIVTSDYCFPISAVGTRDSIHEVLNTGSAEDFHQPLVQRPLSRLIVIDSSGHVKTSMQLRPVMYVGFDISADGRWCALSEQKDPNAPETSAELRLLNLTSDDVLSPEAGNEFGLFCPAFSPDNQTLAAIGVSHDGKRSGVFLSSKSGFDDLQLVGEYFDGKPTDLTWSPEGDWLLVSLESPKLPGRVSQWDAISIDLGVSKRVPLPKVGLQGETLLMSELQHFIWIK